jgi:hypothetical protein
MFQLKQNQVTDVEMADSNWKSLYKVGGVAALISRRLFPLGLTRQNMGALTYD